MHKVYISSSLDKKLLGDRGEIFFSHGVIYQPHSKIRPYAREQMTTQIYGFSDFFFLEKEHERGVEPEVRKDYNKNILYGIIKE